VGRISENRIDEGLEESTFEVHADVRAPYGFKGVDSCPCTAFALCELFLEVEDHRSEVLVVFNDGNGLALHVNDCAGVIPDAETFSLSDTHVNTQSHCEGFTLKDREQFLEVRCGMGEKRNVVCEGCVRETDFSMTYTCGSLPGGLSRGLLCDKYAEVFRELLEDTVEHKNKEIRCKSVALEDSDALDDGIREDVVGGTYVQRVPLHYFKDVSYERIRAIEKLQSPHNSLPIN